MRRHPALHGLSHDHHQLLLLARNLRGEGQRTLTDAWSALQAWLPALEAHFRSEEDLLCPHAGAHADRIRDDHRRILELAQRPDRAVELGTLLRDHIRFEENDVFETLQRTVPDDVLRRLGERLHAEPSGLQACRV